LKEGGRGRRKRKEKVGGQKSVRFVEIKYAERASRQVFRGSDQSGKTALRRYFCGQTVDGGVVRPNLRPLPSGCRHR